MTSFLFPRCTSNEFIYVPSHVPLHQTHSSCIQPFHINAFSHSISSHAHTFCRHIHEYLWVAADFCGKKPRTAFGRLLFLRRNVARTSRKCKATEEERKLPARWLRAKKELFINTVWSVDLYHIKQLFKKTNHPLYTSFNQLILQWAERWQAWFIKHGALSK